MHLNNYHKYEETETIYPFIDYPPRFKTNISNHFKDIYKEFLDRYHIKSELMPSVIHHNIDFKNLDIGVFFYNNLFKDISRNNNLITINIKYIISLEKSHCPNICNTTNIEYGTIDLYKQRALYIIYLPFEEYRLFLNSLIVTN